MRLLGRARRFVHGLVYDATWNIGVVYAPPGRFLDPGFRPTVYWLPTPDRHRFAADPMVVERAGRIYLLYEDFDFASYRGRIYGCELNPGPGDSPVVTWPPREVFAEGLHLSYPFVFEYDGESYCVPERAEGGEVILYRAVELPHHWEKVAVLLGGMATYDNTLFEHEGRWWMLATRPDRRGEPNTDLYLWFAESPFGPWQSHPRNPVKQDPGSARPAGPPFVHEGHLYRPAQDCTRTYGGRVVIQRIERLTPDDFREADAAVLAPDLTGPYPDGLHTMCGAGSLTVLDGKRFVVNRYSVRHNLGVQWSRLRRRVFRSSVTSHPQVHDESRLLHQQVPLRSPHVHPS